MSTAFLAIAGLIAVFAFWVALTYNRFIRGRNLVKEGWSGIDVQLRRRYDLIPNLVNSVKGYMEHERSLLERITELRSRAMSATSVKEKGEAETALARSLRSLFAVAEGYPDLKANQNFLELQKALAEIEDQVQLARRYYNGTARDYNILCESFPNNIAASFFGFKSVDFFDVGDEAARQAPEVRF